jgi:hypothetical protein
MQAQADDVPLPYPLSLRYRRTDYETPALLFGLKHAQLTSIAVLVVMIPIGMVPPQVAAAVGHRAGKPERQPAPYVRGPKA